MCRLFKAIRLRKESILRRIANLEKDVDNLIDVIIKEYDDADKDGERETEK